jgi:hypothetical protein
VARMRVQDAETAIEQEKEDMRNVEHAWLTTTKCETTFEQMLNAIRASATTWVSSRDTWVFRSTLAVLMEPHTLGQRITRIPSPRRPGELHSYLLCFAPELWLRIHNIRMTRVLHSSQWLQWCCCHLHQAWRCLCLSLADSHMAHSPHISFASRFCHLLQYSLHLGYIACLCICFTFIVFDTSEIYCPIFTPSSTMPSLLHILRWSIIGLRCFFHLICILIIGILALIPVDITGSQVKPTMPAVLHTLC